MAAVAFTANLQRHVECPPRPAAGATVREVLDAVFADNPRLRGYVVDERGALRKHMVVFVDGHQIADRAQLSDPVGPASEILRTGLPQHHAYDLVLRHALAIADDGNQLAFGSTTGNLWITDDQGDRWHGLAHHLPPIYAVRYA